MEYFVSYYDYYQPEAYIAHTDTYIEKESTINEEIDRLRLVGHAIAVRAARCRDRRFGFLHLRSGFAGGLLRHAACASRRARRSLAAIILTKLVEILYERNDLDFKRGTFRVRGDTIEVHPTYENIGFRIELWGDEVEKLSAFDPLTGDDAAGIRPPDRLSEKPFRHAASANRTGRGDD